MRLAFYCRRALLAGLTAAACSKAPPPPAPAAPPANMQPVAPELSFDHRWSTLSKGVEPFRVTDDRGQQLMGNVRGATRPAPSPAAAPAEPAAAGENAALPEQPRGDEVDKIVRQNLPAVRGCYLVAARTNRTASGKAIVSFAIGAEGVPTDVKVDAPDFEKTNLPRCVSLQVARWAFPKSAKGLPAVSYPFFFGGG